MAGATADDPLGHGFTVTVNGQLPPQLSSKMCKGKGREEAEESREPEPEVGEADKADITLELVEGDIHPDFLGSQFDDIEVIYGREPCHNQLCPYHGYKQYESESEPDLKTFGGSTSDVGLHVHHSQRHHQVTLRVHCQLTNYLT